MFSRLKYLLLTVFLFFAASMLNKTVAQSQDADTIKVYAEITAEGDTIPTGYMLPVTVFVKMPPHLRRYWAEWTRLRNAVYVTYPYAKNAGRIMREINAQLVNVTDKAQRRAIIHSREKELKKEFTSKLTQLSVYQGKVLMKLIYRETGSNCYEIIDEYKGSFNAAVWQSVAFVFGSSLKQNYDPADKDKVMEAIVKDVERMYGYRS